MNETNDRRRERRLRYNWPIWFSENYAGLLAQGQMVDLSSSGAGFTCYTDSCPDPGERITARFSVPRYGENLSFDMENIIRDGKICRVDEVSPYVRRVAVQFAQPLPFKPGEASDDEAAIADEFIRDTAPIEVSVSF